MMAFTRSGADTLGDGIGSFCVSYSDVLVQSAMLVVSLTAVMLIDVSASLNLAEC